MDLKKRKIRNETLSNLVLRAIIVTVSIFIMTFGFALYLKAELGSDCMSLLVDGLARTIHIPYGTASNAVNISLFVVMFLFNRGSIGFATVISAFCTGTFLQLNLSLLDWIMATPPFWLRILMPIAAAFINAGGIGLYLAMDLGASPFEGLVLTLVSHSKLSYQNSMYLVNFVCFATGVVLGGIWGYGSVVAVVLSGVLFQSALKTMQRLTHSLVKK